MSLVHFTAADDGTAIVIKPRQVVAVRLNSANNTLALIVTTKSNYSVLENVNSVVPMMGGVLVGPFISAIDAGPVWINPAWVTAMRLTNDAGQTLVFTARENYTVEEPFDAVVLALSSVHGHLAAESETRKARPARARM